jgi:hypothetical protein
MDAYWRVANYLSVGQIFLYDNPLLKRPLARTDIKKMLLGHWGTTPRTKFYLCASELGPPPFDCVYTPIDITSDESVHKKDCVFCVNTTAAISQPWSIWPPITISSASR